MPTVCSRCWLPKMNDVMECNNPITPLYPPIKKLRAPFPYFGGKSRIAPLIWEKFGKVENYVEPFMGSLAVLLGAPYKPPVATVNDIDGLLVNAWRGIKFYPEETAWYADYPVSEIDQFAREVALLKAKDGLTERLMADPEYCDPKLAGWWIWGQSIYVIGGWCSGKGPWTVENGRVVKKHGGNGVFWKRPHLSTKGMGVQVITGIPAYFLALSEYLRNVRIVCGDFERILNPSVTTGIGLTAVFLDPPYSTEKRCDNLYAHDDADVSRRAARWALENGNNPQLRIAICGYDDEHDVLLKHGWTKERWRAQKGYQKAQDDGFHSGHREVVWFSPHCVSAVREGPLLAIES